MIKDIKKLQQSIAKKVRQIRQERRWTQKNLAQVLGLSQNRLSEIENGQGSFTAEQLLLILTNFNISVSAFVSPKTSSTARLQNALARLGAHHLSESSDVLPTRQLEDVTKVILETLISAESPRQIIALAPILINHVKRVSINKLKQNLVEVGLARRLGWVLENTVTCISNLKETRYRRSETLLRRYLSNCTIFLQNDDPEDILDHDIFSEKTVTQVRLTSSDISKKWRIITRIQPNDFLEAIESSHETY